jgi:hypothetical protein
MKSIIGVVLALSLMLSVVPALADDTFQAFTKMPATDRARLTPLGDDQLATVEGAASRLGDIAVNLNIAVLNQLNLCVLCRGVVLTNIGAIGQGIISR